MKMKTVAYFILTAVMVISLQGCVLPRNPAPLAQIDQGEIVNFPGIRVWEIEYMPDVTFDPADPADCSFLVLSGGGSKGAFGAGYLKGWSDMGTRPPFKVVTGVSTGALTAPLAFLGSDYDEQLHLNYTTISTKDILRLEGLLGFGILPILTGESVASTKPLQEMIKNMITPEVLEAVAREYAKGRRLYVGSSNLDAQRLAIWDMGAIASSGRPDAIDLFRKVMLASASIPGAFPPVYFPVEIDGKKYDEMHADGGVIAGLFGYGHLFEESRPNGPCNLYIIKNGKLDPEAEQVRRNFLPIVGRSFSTLMKVQSWSDMIRLQERAIMDQVGFHYISLPHDYVSQGHEMFDVEEMKRMYDLGYSMAQSEKPWETEIPFLRKDHKMIWTSMSPELVGAELAEQEFQ